MGAASKKAAGKAKPRAATKSLKDGNRLPLYLVMLANLALFHIAVTYDAVSIAGVEELVKSWWHLLPASAAAVAVGVINELLNSDYKARLVFWRWNNRLPGSRAFTEYARRDSRVDVAALSRKLGTLPIDPREQNVAWYRLYKSVENEPAVSQVHRNYLFTRDYAAISALLVPTLGCAGLWEIPSNRTRLIYLAILLGQYLVVRLAARNHGIRFVTTVLALKAAE